jgi:spermidine synthase
MNDRHDKRSQAHQDDDQDDDDDRVILTEPLGGGVSVSFVLDRVLVEGESEHQHYLIADTPAYGRALFLDRLVQSSVVDEALSHEALIHPGVMLHPGGGPKRVLVAGAGEGASMRELLRHTGIEQILTVDLDREVVQICREHLPQWHQGSFDDPRVELRFEDVQVTLAGASDRAWDMVVLDITDPVEDGPSVELFTVRFFAEVARVLADDGIVAIQCGELDLVDLRVVRTVRTTLLEVFPWVRIMQVFVPSFHCMWAIGLCAKQPIEIEPPDLADRIAALGDVGLRVYDIHQHRALLHLPKFLREALEQPGRVVTGPDDAPVISYDVRGTGITNEDA